VGRIERDVVVADPGDPVVTDGLGVGEHIRQIGTDPVRIVTVPARTLHLGPAVIAVSSQRGWDLPGRRFGPVLEPRRLGLGRGLGFDELPVAQIGLISPDDGDRSERARLLFRWRFE
jgi:hypothetical protein